jgi:hypothetical protein
MDALDEIDFKINNLRDFDRNNLGRIELSQMDLPTKVQADPPEMFIYKNFSEVLNDNQYFCVPELPKGTVLEFELFSTWGDKYYIGLSGIEVFDHKGLVVPIDGNRVSARPSDLNSLPEYKGDPRTPDKLVDGEYLTCDENHSWLAPFYEGKVNRITIDLGRKTSISMIRMWNYNKNRIHSARGARELLIKIDGMLMFFGVVSQAPGDLARGPEQAEYILFTTNKSVLETIEKNDWLNTEPEDGGAMDLHLERPSTSSLMENKFQTTNNEDIKDIRKQIEMNKRKLENLEKEKQEKSKRQAEYTGRQLSSSSARS